MKLLLCSDFSGVAFRWVRKFLNPQNKNVLFISYAKENDADPDTESGAYRRFVSMGCNIDILCKDFGFDKHYDIIFVRGGNTTKLIDYLKEYNQFETVKKMAENGALYIGNSAGAILAGTDTEFCLRAEPYAVDLKKKYNDKDALLGYGWVKKLIFVHCSKYRMAWRSEKENESDILRAFDNENYPAYLVDKKLFKRDTYIKLGNDEAYYENGNEKQILKYHWSHIPVIKK